MPNYLTQHTGQPPPVAAVPEPVPPTAQIDPLFSVELINDETYETPVAEAFMGMLSSIDTHYFFRELTDELDEV